MALTLTGYWIYPGFPHTSAVYPLKVIKFGFLGGIFVFQIQKVGVAEMEIDCFLSHFLFKPQYSYTHSQMINNNNN